MPPERVENFAAQWESSRIPQFWLWTVQRCQPLRRPMQSVSQRPLADHQGQGRGRRVLCTHLSSLLVARIAVAVTWIMEDRRRGLRGNRGARKGSSHNSKADGRPSVVRWR